MTAQQAMHDKIKASFLLGGIGDALGAPLEGMRKQSDIIALYGAEGLQEIIPFTNVFDTGVDYPAGRLTDDTTMAMTTAAAMTLALDGKTANAPEFIETFRRLSHQGYLNWAQHQDDGAEIAAKIDPAIDWTETARAFWFTCGAGRGTIAGLLQDDIGTVEKPLTYDCLVRGKRTVGPNPGCGGMMRVAPIAFLSGLSPEEIFKVACDNAAITHGAPEAYVATGAVALLIHFAAKNMDMREAVAEMKKTLESLKTVPDYAPGIFPCLFAIATAEKASIRMKNFWPETRDTFAAIDALPRDIGVPNPFLALPVLAQTVYAVLSAENIHDVKSAMVLSANHSGDSDSVAAIVGNILGARYGMAALPQEWLDKLIQKKEITEMAELTANTIMPRKPVTVPKQKQGPRP